MIHAPSSPNSSTERASVRPGGAIYLYRELWQLIVKERRRFLGAIALLVGAQLVLLGVPYASGHAINALQLQGPQGLREAGFWLLVMLGITAGSWLMHGPGRLLERSVALAARKRMAANLLERLLQVPLSWHESHPSGATAHRAQQSTIAMTTFAQSQYIYLNSAVRLVGPMLALWLLAPLVGVAALLGFAVISTSVLCFDRAMLRLAHAENAAERQYAATLTETLRNVTTVYALRQGGTVGALLERRLLAVFAPLKRAISLNEAKWCTVDLATKVLACGLVALFVFRGAHSTPAAHHALLLGNLYMVWAYAQQSGDVVSAIASHFQAFARLNADYASADEIRTAGREPTAPVSGPAAQSPAPAVRPEPRRKTRKWHRLELRDLTFHHEASRTPVLDRCSLTLRRGRRYALVGASGSGKSSLLRALAGLHVCERLVLEPDRGPAVRAPFEAARLLRGMATLIPQDAEVFAGTLAENLGMCATVRGTAPDAGRYEHALELAQVSDFLEPSPAGLAAPLAERAANWSGGQRSRVALARGILAAEESALVLLDEPTASLDPATEARVYDALFATFADACIISSVHRMNLLERFDEVLVMQNGRLIAQGPPQLTVPDCVELQRLRGAQQLVEVATAHA
jgi:ATP-binding cassette, subfamily B, bacterial